MLTRASRLGTKHEGKKGEPFKHFEGPSFSNTSSHLALYVPFILFICRRKLIQYIFFYPRIEKTLLNLMFGP